MDTYQIQRLIKQHIWGPVGSVVFHVIIVAMLIVFAVAPSENVVPEVEVSMMETKADVLEEVMKTEIEKVELPPVQEDVTVERPDVATVSTMDVPSDAPGSGAGNSEGSGIGSGDPSLSAGFEVAMAKSPLVMKGLYSARTSGGRKGALSAFGGSSRGEEAVMRALRWFKANQDEDGSWTKTDGHPLAFSGLALLAFLAHGETPASSEFGQTVEKAMRYVVSKQGANGLWSADSYEHAICTYAISEGFGLTKIMALKESMDKGISIIVDGQQVGGGYNYAYEKTTGRWDLSVAGWQFQAMKAAKMAGCTNPKLEEAIKKGMSFLAEIAYDVRGGGFGYDSPSSTPSMTAAGTLCLQLMGKPNAPQVRTALKFMEEMQCTWAAALKGADPKAAAETKQPVYTWYYATQAKFQKGGKDWDSWNQRFAKTLAQSQIVKGTLGHWEGGDHGGPVYTTALCCLMLEVYYRYLPTFKHVEGEKDAPATQKSDDIVVDVI